MNPLAAPVNTSPQATGSGPPAVPAPTTSALDPAAAAGAGAKPAIPISKPPTKGLAALAATERLEQLLLPALAVGGAVYQPDSFLGKKALAFLTGFKVGEAGAQVNKLTPGAALFLLPEPVGALPEHFFMEKPHVPGTNLYLDPLYNYTRYQQRRDDRKRAEAAEAQVKVLQQIVPTFSQGEVAALLSNSDVRRSHIGFVDARVVDSILLTELERRRAIDQNSPTAVAGLIASQTEAQREARTQQALSILTGGTQTVFDVTGFFFDPITLNVRAAEAGYDPFGADALNGSIQPEMIPVLIAAAQRNRDAARGIRRELVSERADP